MKKQVKVPKNKNPEPNIKWLDSRSKWIVEIGARHNRRSKTFDDLTSAREWKYQELGQPQLSAKMTLGEWVKAYLEEMRQEAEVDNLNGKSPRTIHGYEEKLNKYCVPYLGHLQLTELTPIHIKQWIKRIQTKHTTNAAWEATRRLKGCLSAAMRYRLIQTNPCLGINPPQGSTQKLERWTDEEANTVMAYLEADTKNPIRFVQMLWLATGMRKQEILGLRVEDLRLSQNLLWVVQTCTYVNNTPVLRLKTKGVRGNRPITLNEYAVKAIQSQLERVETLKAAAGSEWQDMGLLFPNESGAPLGKTLLYKWHKRTCENAGVREIRPYDYRSTHGTALYYAEVDPKIAAKRLGHTVRVYLDTYVRPLETDLQAVAVPMDKLFRSQEKNPNIRTPSEQ